MSEMPEFYQSMKKQHPELMNAYETLGEAAKKAGPLDGKAVALVKVALSIAAELEGGSHSAVNKALKAGCTPDEIRHVATLAVTTIGFPAMVRARAWIEDILKNPA